MVSQILLDFFSRMDVMPALAAAKHMVALLTARALWEV